MNTRNAIVVALGVVAVLAVGGASLWLALRDAPTASAEQVMQQACANLDDYDLNATITTELGGVVWEEVFTLEASVSGDDYYAKYTASTDGATMELMRLAGQSYYRDSIDGAGWELLDFPLASIDRNLSVLGATPICPSLYGVTREGPEAAGSAFGGSATTRYAAGEGSADALARAPTNVYGNRETSAHKFWVSGSGQLVQHRQERHEQLPLASGAFDHQITTTVTTFSGVSEANTITAPTLGQ